MAQDPKGDIAALRKQMLGPLDGLTVSDLGLSNKPMYVRSMFAGLIVTISCCTQRFGCKNRPEKSHRSINSQQSDGRTRFGE